jgi:hypothetical protein
MAGQLRGSDDHDPEEGGRMTALERNSRRLLRAYPAAYRRERGDEIIGTLLETTPDGRSWPRLRDARALIVCGLQTRAAQSRQFTTAANLRVAVMVGLALYVTVWAASFATRVIIQVAHGYGFGAWSGWQLTAWSVLSAATVVLAWTAPRISVLTGALAIVAGVAYYVALHISAIVPASFQALYLIALVALGLRGPRPSLRWLWLLGVIAVASPWIAIVATSGWIGLPLVLVMPNALLAAVALVGALVIAFDARLMLALVTYVLASAAQSIWALLQYGGFELALVPVLLAIVAVAALAIWLLRRQSARPARTA